MYFHVAKSRGSDVLKEVLGNSDGGILGVDRWGAYSKYHKGRLQLCWEHLKRDFKKIYELGCKIESNEAIIFAEIMKIHNILHLFRKPITSLRDNFFFRVFTNFLVSTT